MHPIFYKPHPALCSLVNNIMISHIKTDTQQKKISFPFPPLPEHSIFFYPFDKPTIENLASERTYTLPGCTIVGPQSDRLNLTFGHNHLVIKIGFQPGGLYRLLGFPMEEMLIYKDLDGRDIFGQEINRVIEQLSNKSSDAERIVVIEIFLFRQTLKSKKIAPIDLVIPDILKNSGLIKIDQLVKNVCMSSRQFERVFKERIGLSPKFYCRLVRFAKAWLIKERKPSITWTEII